MSPKNSSKKRIKHMISAEIVDDASYFVLPAPGLLQQQLSSVLQ